MIQDLGCVKLENDEAIRYATTWAREGLPAAERSRKITRMRGQSESTPGRDGNYMDFDNMITALALQLVRDDLYRNKDDNALSVVDELMIKMEDDDGTRSVLERVLHDTQGPRSFMEQLYYKGITDGVKKNNGKNVNILKVAENLFDARISIAKESAKLLSLQSMQNRQYYKMIKDMGGFTKLDMSSLPKMKFIDLDARARDEAREEAAHAFEDKINNQLKSAEMEKEAILSKKIENEKNSQSEGGEVEKEVEEEDYSNSGPMMM